MPFNTLPQPATTQIKLTPMGRKQGAPAISIHSPLIVEHYAGTYADAIAIFNSFGPHLPNDPAEYRAISVVKAELLLKGSLMACKMVKAPTPRPDSQPWSPESRPANKE